MMRTDTDPGAANAYVSAFAAVSGAERVARAVQMAEEARAVALAGIRFRGPGKSEAEVFAEWLRLLHGDVVAGTVLATRRTSELNGS